MGAAEASVFWAEVGRRRRDGRGQPGPIVDADTHAGETLADVARHMDPPWRRRAEVLAGGEELYVLPFDLGDETVGGRIRRPPGGGPESLLLAQRALGAACSVVFPSQLLSLGLHPDHGMEAAIALGYARWMTEEVLPRRPSLRAMLYLPFGDAEAGLGLVRAFGERPGVAGFVVTSIRHQMVHENRYMPVYGAIEERDLALAFHPSPFWRDRQFDLFGQFLAACAVSVPLYNMVHLLNLVLHGIPERFPRLRLLFCEAGVAWLPFVMYRVDMEFLKRPSEAPLLRRRPSEYLHDIYFTTHPLEVAEEARLQGLLRMVDAPHHLVYASNAPSWDMDLPERILGLDLPEADRRRILGGNAARLFRLDELDGSEGEHDA